MPARIFSIVLLPQPDGPTKTPTSPARSENEMRPSTSWRSPAAFSKCLPVISTSSCTRPPPRYTKFKGLQQQGLDHEHHGRKGQRIGQQQRDVEQLERNADLEADAVRASQQFRNQHDLPHQRK